MILNERDSRHEEALRIARQMMVAARTAPKTRGVDILEVALVTESNIRILADTMRQMYEDNGMKSFLRDADNLLSAECVVLVGTQRKPVGLNCGWCGFPECGEKPQCVPCAFNSVDVGIAVGSACALAADLRADTRVMYSAGTAAERLGWLEGCSSVLAIPISISSKNPFFDRKPVG